MIQKVTVKSWKSYDQHTPKGNEKMKKQEQQKNGCRERSLATVSYTHLTLPTTERV